MITELDIKNMFGRHQMDDNAIKKVDDITERFENLALEILNKVSPSPEQTVAIRKLMEAKQQTVFAIVKDLPLVND